MTITIKSNPDGVSGAIQVNGNDAVVFGTQGITQGAPFSFRNKIINGDMRIDQRNAGASVTPSASTYTLDRWRLGASVASKVSVQQSTVAPEGFKNSTLITSLSAYTMGGTEEINFGQRIEGFNAADLGWGTANAKSITLSFWVRSSLTGLFSGVIKSFDSARSYVFSYTIGAANTWEYKTITVAGDTTGTWKTDNDIGIIAQFCIASASLLNTAGVWYGTNTVGVTGTTQLVATNGATFYITGVQLEAGSVATPFEHRPYGAELALCQRYYEVIIASAQGAASTNMATTPKFVCAKRATPTVARTGSWNTGNEAGTLISTVTAAEFLVYNPTTNALAVGGVFTASAEL